MKKHFKKIIATALLVVLSVVVGGCGKQETAKKTDKVTVKLWSSVTTDSTQEKKDLYEREMKALKTKFTNVEFNVVTIATGTDYRQEYDKALMAGTAPDMFDSFSYTDIPSRIKNKTIANISEIVKNWDLKKEGKVITTFDNAISQGEEWYAIPRAAYVQGTLANLKTIKEGGGDINNLPTTWDEFAAMGSKITDMNVPRIGYELIGMDWCAWPYTAWVWSAGGEMVKANGDGTYKLSFNEKPGVEAAFYLNQMIWKYKMTQKNVLNSYEDVLKDVRNGAASFSWAGFNNLDKDSMTKYGLSYADYTMIPMPVRDASIKRPALSGGEVLTFNPKASKETLQAAFDAANYLYYSDEFLINEWQIGKEKGTLDIGIPARKDLYEKKLELCGNVSAETKKNVLEMSKNAIAEPYCNNWSDLKSQLVNPLQKIMLTENITKEEVQKILDACAEQLYNLYPDSFKK